jgi:hypothetical protein
MIRWLVFVILLILLLPSLAFALEVDSLRGTSQTFDAGISEINATTNYGTSTSANISLNTGQVQRYIFAVDSTSLAGLGVGTQLITSTLRVYVTAQAGSTIGLYELAKPFKEASATWNGWSGADTNWAELGGDETGTITAAAQNRGKWAYMARDYKVPTLGLGWGVGTYPYLQADDGNYAIWRGAEGIFCFAEDFNYAIPTGAVVDSLGVRIDGCYDDYQGGGTVLDAYMAFGYSEAESPTELSASNRLGDTSCLSPLDIITCALCCWDAGVQGEECYNGFNDMPPLWSYAWTPELINSPYWGILIGPKKASPPEDGGTDSLKIDSMSSWVVYHADTALDRAATAMSTAAVTATGWVSFDLDTALVRDWIDGTKKCYGLMLIATSGTGVTTITTSEGTAANTPILEIMSAASVNVIDEDGDLPYTVSTNYDTVVIVNTVHATDRALTINTGIHDVIICQSDPESDTIYWGEGGLDNAEGIYINNNCYNITMDDINLVLNAPADSLTWGNAGYWAQAIMLGSGVHDVTFRDSYVLIAGYGSQAWVDGDNDDTGPGNYNINIRNIKWDNRSTSFYDRQDISGYVMVSIAGKNGRNQSGFQYHCQIHACTTLAANWVNYYFEGDSLTAEIDSCYLLVDGLNEYPNNGTIGSASQAYAIITSDDNTTGVGSFKLKITNNTIRSGNEHAGGEGIGMGSAGADTTESDGTWVYNNDIQVHKGYDSETSNMFGVGVRQYANNIVIRKNKIYVWGDTDNSDSAYGDFAVAYRTYATLTIPAKIIIDSNDIRSTFRDLTATGTTSTGAYAIMLGAAGSAEGIQYRYNHVAGGTAPYLIGEPANGNDNDNGYSIGDTLEILDSGTTNQYSIYSCVTNSIDNRFQDCYFDTATGATPANIATVGNGSLYMDRSVVVHVIDSNGADVENARVRITNAYGRVLETDTTDVNGVIPVTTASLKYEHWGTTSPNGVDSTYTPFYIDAITNLGTEDDSVREAQAWYWYTDTATIITAPVGGTDISIATPQIISASSTCTVMSLLALPRDKSVAQDGGLYIFPGTASYASTCPNEFYSTDSGETWTEIDVLIDAAGAAGYHLPIFGQPGHGIHFTPSDDVANGIAYRFMDKPCTTAGNMNDLRQITTSAYDYSTIAAKGDTAWAVVRRSNDDDTLIVIMSVDTMKTRTEYGRTRTNSDCRVGLFTDDNELPVLFIYLLGYGYYMMPWQGTSLGFRGQADSVITTDVNTGSPTGDRAFTVCYTDQWHLIYGHNGTSGDYLIHCRDTGSGWAKDTVSYNNDLGAIRFAPKAGVRNDTIFLAFGTGGAPSDDPNTMWLKIFDPVTDTWSADSTLLSGEHIVAGSFQIPSKIPTTFSFVPYFFASDGSPDSLWFGKIQLSGESNSPPVVAGFIDSTIAEGASFGTLALDNYVTDPNDPDANIEWSSYTIDATDDFTVSIVSRVATITAATSDSYGEDTIVFRAEDPSSAADEDTVIYTITAVNDAPVVTGIPDQGITVGSTFATITLDNYVTDIDNTDAQMTWTYSGNTNLGVSIVSRVATITNTNPLWTGAENITFRATDPSALYDDDIATFTVNAAPVEWHKVKGLKRGHKP